MSVRASTSLPSTCSGAIYCRVPRIAAFARDRVVCSVGSADDWHAERRPACVSFAKPKSSSLAPRLGQHDVAGLQIAVHDALAVRVVERVGNLNGVLQHLLRRQRSFQEPVRQRLAFQKLHHQIIGCRPDGRRRRWCRCEDDSGWKWCWASRSNRSRRFGSVREIVREES